ncbi:MAG: iron-containing alcohol dehydrogenase [Candidatus Dormiibacterota bacterium]
MPSVHVGSPVERVLYGPGSVRSLASELESLGRSRVVLVCSATLASRSPLVSELEHGIGSRHQTTFTGLSQHTPEEAVEKLARLLVEQSADAVVSFGGGSVIDGCKAALHEAEGTSATHIALPTTLSGAEFTASAGVTAAATQQKRSIVDRGTAPRVVILDPELTLPTPVKLWLGSGIRAVDHAVETIWSPVPDLLSRLLAGEALKRLRSALPACSQDPGNLAAREQAQLAAWWAALGLASVPMGPSHSLGKLLGAPFGIPHGITSCVLLPVVIAEMARREPERVAGLTEAFGVSGAEEVAPACRDLVVDLGLPSSLSGAGLSRSDLPVYLNTVPDEWREVVRAAY